MASEQHRATLESELDLAWQTGDAAAEAALLLQLGTLARAEEEYDLAQVLYMQSWSAFQRADDAQGSTDALCALVELYAMLWMDRINISNTQAQPMGWLLCGDVIAQYEQLGDVHGLARGWIARADLDLMGIFSDGAGRIRLYEQALAVYERDQDLVGQALVLSRIAQVHKGSVRTTEAQDFFERAIALYEQAGKLENAVTYLLKLADLRSGSAENAAKIGYHKRVIAHYETLKQPQKMANLLSFMGQAAADAHDYDMAAQYYAQEIALHEQYGDRPNYYQTALEHLGYVSMRLKAYDTARASFLRALVVCDAEQWFYRTLYLLQLGRISARTGDLMAGRAYAQQAFVMGESVDDTEDLRHRLELRRMWARIEVEHQNPDQARQMLNAALTFAQKYPNGRRYTDALHADLAALDSNDPTDIQRFLNGG